MKIKTFIVTIVLSLILIFLGYNFRNLIDYSTAIFTVVIVLLMITYLYFEKSSMGTKEIALIATLSAFAGASRVPFAVLPNIQPTTFLVALFGYVFGIYRGFLIGVTTAFISNIFLGQGPWTIWQMLAWGIVGALSGIIGSKYKKQRISTENFSFICFLYGFIFDWIMNLWHILGYIKPLTLESIILTYVTSLSFDIMHSTGNFVFSVMLFDSLYKVLNRFRKKLEITYINKF